MQNDKNRKYMRTITAAHDGQRIDNYLIFYYKGVPKSRLYRALRKGEVRKNGGRCRPTDRIHQGDVIRLPPLHMKTAKQVLQHLSENALLWLEQAIIYEDETLLVLNKPAGLAVHGGTGIKQGLMDFLAVLRPEQYLRLVHRIDQATSGVILVAKDRQTLLAIQAQMKARQIEKRYLAACLGKMPKSQMTVENHLQKQRDGATGVKVHIAPQGKWAKSVFCEVNAFEGLSLVDVQIETGRMHQIRVHAAYLGMPIAGDDKYNKQADDSYQAMTDYKGLHLHCWKMTFQHQGKAKTFEAPVPQWVIRLKG